MTRIAVEPGATKKIDVGDKKVVLFYGDNTVRFQHVCDRTGRGTITCAPLLDPAHTVLEMRPLTIHPSIQCPDCGTHGYVTGGKWKPC